MPSEREIQISSGSSSHRQWVDSSGRQMTIIVPPTVYPPREDSTLLDQALNTIIGGGKMLEIGCGTGVVSVSSAKRGWIVDACDINPLAIASARGLAEQEGVSETTRFIETGLPESVSTTAGLDWAPSPPYDLICWNLPYLDPPKPGEPRLGPFEEASMSDIDTAGGWSRNLRNQLENTPDLLSQDGVVVLIHKAEGRGGRSLTEWLAAGWSIRPLARLSFGGERLVAAALWRGWSDSKQRSVDETESTMDEMRQDAQPGTVVRAISQTGGRGQRDKLWHSTNGDLTATWRVHNGMGDISAVGIMQLGAGLAVVDSIAARRGRIAPMLAWPNASEERRLGLQLRWPNDILFTGVGGNYDANVKPISSNLNGTKSGNRTTEDRSDPIKGLTEHEEARNLTESTVVGKLGGILMQGRTIGQSTTIDVGIGINGITRWLGDECHAGITELGLTDSAVTLLPSLAAALGGRFQNHNRLPPASTSELQKQWWALAVHQQLSHASGNNQQNVLSSHLTKTNEQANRQQENTVRNIEKKIDNRVGLEQQPAKFNEKPLGEEQKGKGSQLGELEETGKKNPASRIRDSKVDKNESFLSRIIGIDNIGGLIILNSTQKIILYESR